MANLFNYLFGFLSILLGLNKKKILNLSNYKYPSPKDKEYTYIPIIATTDLHGYGFQRHIPSSHNFSYGGASLLSSYIDAIRKEWGKDNFLYLDSGDKYQGGAESTISNATIMTEIFNYLNLHASAIGNHEFDNGLNFFEKQMNLSKSPFITTNIRKASNNDSNAFNAKNFLQKKIYEINGIKIGILGYTPLFTYYAGNDVLDKLNFLKMKDSIIQESKILREQDKVNSVVLIIHYGIECYHDSQELNIYNISHSHDSINCNIQENELYEYIMEYPGTIDVVFGGHVHYPGHHFFNGIPVIHSKDRGVHFHIAYLPFKNGQLIKENIQVEGPIPLCDRISNQTKTCTYNDRNDEMFQFTFHNSLIRYNEKIERSILNKYYNEFSKYKKFVCFNEDAVIERTKTENIIGNLETDAIRNKTSADFALLNNGAFRAVWYPGTLYLEDILNMNPFFSKIVTIEMTGAEIYQAMNILQTGKKRYYAVSGMRQFFKQEKGIYVIKNITLSNGKEIEKNRVYVIATNEFIAGGGDEFKDVLKWYKVKNKKYYDKITDTIEEYLVRKQVLKKSDYYEDDPKKRRLVFLDA